MFQIMANGHTANLQFEIYTLHFALVAANGCVMTIVLKGGYAE
jgi:hypothetical protein